MTNIDRLPNEILKQILQYPDLCRSDIEAAGKTCQRWFNICEEILKEKTDEAAEISDSWKNTFRRDKYDNRFRDQDSRKFVIEYRPPLSQVISAASLARQGFLTSVRSLALVDVDITGVPTEDMAKLLECVTESVYIENLRGDVTLVFSNINCVVLVIDKIALSSSDTQALVGAMDTRAEEVCLYEGVTLDWGTLTQYKYDGTGKCGYLRTWNINAWCDYLSDYEEDEESLELDDNEEEDSDNEVEDVLNNSDSEGAEAAEVDSGKSDVKEDLEITKEQIQQDLANMSLSVNCIGEDEESDG